MIPEIRVEFNDPVGLLLAIGAYAENSEKSRERADFSASRHAFVAPNRAEHLTTSCKACAVTAPFVFASVAAECSLTVDGCDYHNQTGMKVWGTLAVSGRTFRGNLQLTVRRDEKGQYLDHHWTFFPEEQEDMIRLLELL